MKAIQKIKAWGGLASLFLWTTVIQAHWSPPINALWQWQLDGEIDTAVVADIFDLDLFETPAAIISELKANNKKLVCYISVGTWEAWRPDADQFPAAIIGADYDGWPDEKWLDIRRLDLLAPIISARLDLCRDKGFDAVEPDNIDAFENETGFDLSYEDQLRYNRWLAEQAHQRGLSIGLKNDASQVKDLVHDYDWALVESCVFMQECTEYMPFIQNNKAVLAVEYVENGLNLDQLCPHAAELRFQMILKYRDLKAWRQLCSGSQYYQDKLIEIKDKCCIRDHFNRSSSVKISLQNVQIQYGALVNLRAPIVNIQPEFRVHNGAYLRIAP